MKKLFAVFYIFILSFLSVNVIFAKDYNVMIGAKRHTVLASRDNNILVIDAYYFSKDDIKKLHNNKNKEVLSYLNIGSIEKFRDDFKYYKNIISAPYENWEDEYWVDITADKWQKRIADIAYKLDEKGIDGFFLDNADVYYHYKNDKVYDALIAILEELKQYDKKVIINGGDEFVKEFIKQGEDISLISGINQESVLTKIDFKNNRFLPQDKNTKKYFKDYLKLCKSKGFEIFILEYIKGNKKINNAIKNFCDKNGYRYMISDSLKLD